MKIVIVDDSASSRQWLEQKVAAYMHHRGITYDFISFESGEAFVSALELDHFDIVFMDIYMGEMTGISAAKKLRELDMDCRLVFLTTSRDFFQAGYAFMPRHYLVKPVTDADFEQAMDNCQIRRQVEVPFLPVVSERVSLQLDTTRLMYVDVCARNTVLHMTDRQVGVSDSMGRVTEPLVKDKRFLTCIQGVLVNMDYIEAVEDSVFLLKNGERLQITLRNKAAIIRQYRTYIYNRMEERRNGL